MTAVPTLPTVPPGLDDAPGPLRQVLRPRWRSIVLSVGGCVVVAVALLVALPRPHADAVKAVDPASTIARARVAAPSMPIFTPDPLPAGFVPDSVHLEVSAGQVQLNVGYLSPDFAYVSIDQTNLTKRRIFTSQTTGGGTVSALVDVAGVVWARYDSTRRVQPSLVFYGPHSEVIVTGTASLANLELLAASLHVLTPPATS